MNEITLEEAIEDFATISVETVLSGNRLEETAIAISRMFKLSLDEVRLMLYKAIDEKRAKSC